MNLQYAYCDICKNEFSIESKLLKYKRYDKKRRGTPICCSKECNFSHRNIKPKSKVACSNCKKLFDKYHSQIKTTKHNFCCQTCAATFSNKNKSSGTRRSKLETYLEAELQKLYPNLEIHFNRKDSINSELDIFIPSLKLAFELNGIFHYEPIYGQEKLSQIQNNDNRKFQACLEQGIELCIIDTRRHTYVTQKSCCQYLNIIIKIIETKLVP